MLFKIIIVVVSILSQFSCSSLEPPIWQNDPRCGIKESTSTNTGSNARIIAGVNATFGEFPWQAALAFNYEEFGYSQESGATIIHKQWVLISGFDAVQNLDGNEPTYSIEQINIWAGIVNVHDEVHKVIRNVTKRIIHPQRNFTDFGENSIALLKLDRELDFDVVGIKPICFPEREYDMTGQDCSISGWGEPERDVPNGFDLTKLYDLTKINVTIWSQQYCREVFKDYSLTDMTFCAVGNPQDVCYWDAGAALACNPNNENRWFMQGMAMHDGCGHPYVPTLYANIYKYIPWISKTIAEN